MPWLRLDDGILEHPKVAAAGPIGFALHIAAIVYAGRNLTDGFIPYGHARRLLATSWTEGEEDPEKGRGPQIWELSMTCGMTGLDGDETIERTISLLCELGLWEEAAHGYFVHDYLEYNPSKEEVEQARADISAKRSEAGKKGADARWNGKNGKPIASGMATLSQTDGPVPVPHTHTSSLGNTEVNRNNSDGDDVNNGRAREATEEDGAAAAEILEIGRNREAVEIVLHAMRRNPTLGWTFEARRCKAHYTSWQHWTPGQRALKFSDWLERQTRIEARDAARFQPAPQLAVVPSQEEPTAPPPKPEVWPHHGFPLWDDIQPALFERVGAAAWHQRGWANVVPISFDEASGFLTLRPAPEMWEYRELLDSQLTMDVEQGAILMGQFGIRRVLWEPFRREATA